MGRLKELRVEYHRKICRDILGRKTTITDNNTGREIPVYSNADKSSRQSVLISYGISQRLNYPHCSRVPGGQSAGSLFARYTKEFLEESFLLFQSLRPGTWGFSTEQRAPGIASYYQYEHLYQIQQLVQTHIEIKTALGNDYLITPDIILSRMPETDEVINANEMVIDSDDKVADCAPLRSSRNNSPILLSSLSCKWTMRSDRAQNTRTEALNLIRNRKGSTPHIMAITFEPLPSRIASIAMGTGDIDCTYHGALYELLESIEEYGFEDALELLKILIDGKRLKDISDLPLDLAI
jgi:hypothetical protein